MPFRRRFLPILVGWLILFAPACEETDQVLVFNIGTVRLYFSSTGIAPQSFEDPDGTLQASESTAGIALMDLGGVPVDLVIKQGDESRTCRMLQTSDTVATIFDGRCGSGMVIDAEVGARSYDVTLSFDMRVLRAKPEYVVSGTDTDGDSVLDEDDNCPFVFNPEQQDTGQDGYGDACKLIDLNTGRVLRDTDGDVVIDATDNCLWTPNPDQSDAGLDGTGIPDGIGDACEEQSATVRGPEGSTIRVVLGPEELDQTRNTVNNITVDIPPASLSCDWDAGLCQMDTTQLRLCAYTSVTQSILGCPI